MVTNPIALDFIKYWLEYGNEEDMDVFEAAGNWACKYSENQDEVNEVLDQIDELLVKKDER